MIETHCYLMELRIVQNWDETKEMSGEEVGFGCLVSGGF